MKTTDNRCYSLSRRGFLVRSAGAVSYLTTAAASFSLVGLSHSRPQSYSSCNFVHTTESPSAYGLSRNIITIFLYGRESNQPGNRSYIFLVMDLDGCLSDASIISGKGLWYSSYRPECSRMLRINNKNHLTYCQVFLVLLPLLLHLQIR